MSITRTMIANLRRRLGEDRPLAEPPKPARKVPPPARIFPRADQGRSGYAEEARRYTTALVGIGHVGTRYATDVVLQFQAELAVAHAAVAAELPDGWGEANGLFPLKSKVQDHREYLLRPDLGRRLDEDSRARLKDLASAQRGEIDLLPILADGLSAGACTASGMEVLEALKGASEAHGLKLGPSISARYARVWLEDEIGEILRAKVAVIILGERPGLGTGDGLSAYMVYDPKVGRTDGERNMISNIHARGIPPGEAGQRLVKMAKAMLEQSCSGVDLDLSLLKGVERGQRPPQARERLVKVGQRP